MSQDTMDKLREILQLTIEGLEQWYTLPDCYMPERHEVAGCEILESISSIVELLLESES